MLKCTWRNVRDSDTEMEKREFPFFFRREKRKDKGERGEDRKTKLEQREKKEREEKSGDPRGGGESKW